MKYEQDAYMLNQVKWDEIREARSRLLNDADKLVNVAEDAGIDSTVYRNYRQALRDIPQNFDDPDAVVWPEKPTV